MKANLLAVAALVSAALALASCGDSRVIPAPAPTTPVPPRAGASPVAPPPAATAWIDAPVTPGDWRWSMEGGQSVARFAGQRLVLRCDPSARIVRIERSEPAGTLPTNTTLTVRTQNLTRAFAAVPQGTRVTVNLAARDPLLDAMAFTRGRFAIETTGMPALYVPSWTEVSRVIEDCR